MIPNYDVEEAMLAWETGKLDSDASIELFQYMVDTGLAWELRGPYGRTAWRMVEAGLLKIPAAA